MMDFKTYYGRVYSDSKVLTPRGPPGIPQTAYANPQGAYSDPQEPTGAPKGPPRDPGHLQGPPKDPRRLPEGPSDIPETSGRLQFMCQIKPFAGTFRKNT